MTDDVIIFENIGDNPINFDTKEDFIRYYTKNKSTIDQIKTRGLNRKYKIDGYKIGRQKGVIVLFPERKSKENSNENSNENLNENLENEYANDDLLNTKIDLLNSKLQKIESMLKEILDNL